MGCLMSKTDLYVQKDPSNQLSAGFKQHGLLFELMGPSATVEVGPKNTRLGLGAELGLGPFWESVCQEGDFCSWMGPALHYSVIGLQFVEFQREEETNHFGFASPYLQLHIPFKCSAFSDKRSFKDRDPDRCVSVFGSVEYQNRLQSPNQVFLGVGLSYAFLLFL